MDQKENVAKNIILLIGDGMGISQITAGLYANNNEFALEHFNYIGLHKSYSADDLITDSGAGATAISIGSKTYNAAIGMDVDTLPRKTILEEAEERGYATGMIATSSITHATPAAFIAHVKNRKMHAEIALDFLDTEIDYFVGGGLKFFQNREDGKDLIKLLEEKNYRVANYKQLPLDLLIPPVTGNFAYFTADNSPASYQEGRNYLLTASEKALDYLPKKSEKGFFLMIESSQIDWGGHDNDESYIVSEMLEFNKVIEMAYQFTFSHPETLVIVTADHETGGMAINSGSKLNDLVTAYSTTGHTADLVPVFAYGPGAEKFIGIYENTELFHKMRSAFGWINKE